MKRIYLITIILFAAHQLSFAQWTTSGTNIYNSNTGNVGIGTTSPSNNLQIGTSTIVSSSSPITLSLGGTYSSTHGINPKLKVYDDGTSFWGLGISLSQLDYIVNTSSNDHVFYAGGTELMRIKGNGNVGIGTSTPTSLFSVVGGAVNLGTNLGQYSLASVDNSSTSPLAIGASMLGLYAGDLMLRSYWGVSIDLNDGLQGDGGAAPYTRIPQTASFTINSRTSSTNFTPLFVVRNNGNVLIGKTSQNNTAYKLDVAGGVRANAITVNTSGADFVFEPTYKLSSLSDLKKYIEQNHHLPEIASAQQMQQDGLNVGENQTKLLQKVEELTLYLIEQQKQINQLKQQINTITKN